MRLRRRSVPLASTLVPAHSAHPVLDHARGVLIAHREHVIELWCARHGKELGLLTAQDCALLRGLPEWQDTSQRTPDLHS